MNHDERSEEPRGPGPSAAERLRSAGASATGAIDSARRGLAWVERHPYLGVPVLTAHRIGSQHLPTHAAALSFQTVISIFPLIAVLVAGASFFVEPDVLTEQVLKSVDELAPESRIVLEETIRSVKDLRGQIGVVSLLGLLWTGSSVFGALRRGLNAAVGASRRRQFIRGRVFDLSVAVLTGGLLAGSVAITAALAVVERLDTFGEGTALEAVGVLLRAVGVAIPIVASTVIFAVLFRVVPVTNLPWRAALGGGALAAVLFEAGKNLFVWYASSFGSFNAIYGPISTIVVLLVWLYYSGLIVLSGAAFGSSLETAGHFRQRHPSPGA